MSDPLRTDPARPSDTSADFDKEARIEQLLLAGLDEYFAGQYEQAINIWTRVVFLERGHDRARAYIERARGALAERHRECDELLHHGIAAFNDGQTETARDLITRAVEQGGPHDVALALLERLNRLAAPVATPDGPRSAHPERRSPPPRDVKASDQHRVPLHIVAGLAIAAGALGVAVLTGLAMPDWLADPAGLPQQQVATMPPDPLPVASSAERLVARARALQSSGHLHDALRTLDAVDVADPSRQEADRLRGELQRQLLEAGTPPGAVR
ncbi:MAG: hypothetical protein ACRD26_17275 [Vicinamibacterales bacterium]